MTPRPRELILPDLYAPTFVELGDEDLGALSADELGLYWERWLSCRRANERRVRQRVPVSIVQRTRILERDDFRCRRCGTGPREERLVVDHIVAVALGGTSDDDNLQTLCEPCNQGKGAREPHAHDLRPSDHTGAS